MKEKGVDLDAYEENFERAVMSLVCWSQMILDMKPDCWFRLEDAHETLPRFLASRGMINRRSDYDLQTTPINADKLYKGERHPKPEICDSDWDKLSPQVVEGLQWYCDHFGYSLPGKLGCRRPVGGKLTPDVTCQE